MMEEKAQGLKNANDVRVKNNVKGYMPTEQEISDPKRRLYVATLIMYYESWGENNDAYTKHLERKLDNMSMGLRGE